MSSTPRLIGTLIVVVLKAKNLPNKRHIGKQDPYCTLKLHADTKRTKAIKRGGQHPEWDEEIRFELFEDVEDELARTARGTPDGGVTPPRPPPKDKERKVKGGKTMRLLCYADDPREPELIGEAVVDLSEVLKKGETDEWYTLMNKDKYSGEVYLELTFWSNDKPPEKKQPNRPSNLHPQYGGPGSFTPSDGPTRTGRGSSGGSSPAGDRIPYHDRQSSATDGIKSMTSSLAQLNLYIPPYDQGPAHHQRKYDPSMEFGDPSRRRDSYPPRNSRPTSSYGFQGVVNFGPPANPNPYDNPAPAPTPVPEPYANNSPSSYYQSSQSAAYTNSLYQPNPQPVASGFVPPQPAMTPHPSGFQPINYSTFGPPHPAATPMPSFAPPPSSMGFHGYQAPGPTGYPAPTPQPPAHQANPAVPPFQNNPNSFPSTAPPNPSSVSGLPFTGSMSATTAPIPQPYGVPPHQPQQAPVPNPPFQQNMGYNPTQQPASQPTVNQSPPVQPTNNAPAPTPAPNGFVPPPPPPPINQPHRSSSLPMPPANGVPPPPAVNGAYPGNPSLTIPPQQPQSQQNTGGTISANNTGGSGRSGLPLPPLPNPPGQVQSAFHTGPPASSPAATPLPGPPPPLKPGFAPQQPHHSSPKQQQQPTQHQQQSSFSNGNYAPQPQYGQPSAPQSQPQQQQQQYPSQQAHQQPPPTPWQPNQPAYNNGPPPGQYAPTQPSVTPVPQYGAYPPPPQVPTPSPWY